LYLSSAKYRGHLPTVQIDLKNRSACYLKGSPDSALLCEHCYGSESVKAIEIVERRKLARKTLPVRLSKQALEESITLPITGCHSADKDISGDQSMDVPAVNKNGLFAEHVDGVMTLSSSRDIIG